MIKISYFNYKISTLLSTLAITSSLTFAASANHTLPGFHITVKENNNNVVKLASTWNTINDKYERLLENNSKEKLINVEFSKWSDVTNQLQPSINLQSSTTDVISKEVSKTFQKQSANPNNGFVTPDEKKHFDKTIIGRSFANKNFDSNISSFGSVYLNYNDQLANNISNGLFATVDPQSSFTDYFSVPYTLQASVDILKKPLDQRLKVIPIGDDRIKSENENQLVILAKNANENLVIKSGDTTIKTIENGNLSYAIIGHNPKDEFKPTNFSVDVTISHSNNEELHRDVIISNNTSRLSFTTEQDDKQKVDCQYLVQKVADSNNLIVMNSAKGSATVNIVATDEKWTIANVDAKTLTIDNKTQSIVNNGTKLTASNSSEIQVYYLSLDTKIKAQQQASGQYITIYNQNQVPTFNNCTDLFDDGNVTLQGFQQYLISTVNFRVEDLKNNPSALLSQFINYQGAIAKHDYVNYLTSNSNAQNPFHVNAKYSSKTLVNNWNIIILIFIFFSILIISPFMFLLLRKRRKRLK